MRLELTLRIWSHHPIQFTCVSSLTLPITLWCIGKLNRANDRSNCTILTKIQCFSDKCKAKSRIFTQKIGRQLCVLNWLTSCRMDTSCQNMWRVRLSSVTHTKYTGKCVQILVMRLLSLWPQMMVCKCMSLSKCMIKSDWISFGMSMISLRGWAANVAGGTGNNLLSTSTSSTQNCNHSEERLTS